MEGLGLGLLLIMIGAASTGAVVTLIALTVLSLFVAMPVWLVSAISLGAGVAIVPAFMWWMARQ